VYARYGFRLGGIWYKPIKHVILGLPLNRAGLLFFLMKISLTCIFILLSPCLLYAQRVQQKLELNVAAGYERQDLKWSIAGNAEGKNPNIYSELQWQKVGGATVSADLQWNFFNKFSLTANYSHGSIQSGIVTDNDYNGDNRTDPAYDQLFNANKGSTKALSAGLGYIIIDNSRFSFTPFIGYSTGNQSLFLLDRTGNLPDLNSTYQTEWKGPFIKAAAAAKLVGKLKLKATLAYMQANYNAKANWNMIPSFQHPVSYRHNAKGYGIEGDASLMFNITTNLAINAGAGYFTSQTGKGIDELFLSSGGSQTTQLNGVDRKGYRLFAGITFNY
jgi:outer membrane protease